MSHFGMQMPGGRAKRGASPDVYSALSFVALAFLIAACVLVFRAGKKVGPGGSAFELQQPGSISIAAPR